MIRKIRIADPSIRLQRDDAAGPAPSRGAVEARVTIRKPMTSVCGRCGAVYWTALGHWCGCVTETTLCLSCGEEYFADDVHFCVPDRAAGQPGKNVRHGAGLHGCPRLGAARRRAAATRGDLDG